MSNDNDNIDLNKLSTKELLLLMRQDIKNLQKSYAKVENVNVQQKLLELKLKMYVKVYASVYGGIVGILTALILHFLTK
ncbi:MAG: hypothetical protein JXR60_12270 [Bacteroidales bacterium]|nr:hypothetical protein [Bacteroidales bacterium]